MTRMKKWQSYREELAKQANVSIDMEKDEVKRIALKAEIDKINPAILSSTKNETAFLQNGVSNVEISQNEIPLKIAEMFATINKATNTINQDKVESILNEMKNEKYVDKNNNFKEEKLLRDYNYALFKRQIQDLNFNGSGNDEIEKQLKSKYDDLTTSKQKHEVATIIAINKETNKQLYHSIFIVSVIVVLAMIFIVLALCITKMALK